MRYAQIIISRLADILASGDRGKDLEDAWKIYDEIRIRTKVYAYPSQVIESINRKYAKDYPAEKVAKLLKESMRFIYANDEKMENDVGSDMFIIHMRDEIANDNIGIEERYKKDKDYGLTPEKPIFVKGLYGLHLYLDNLLTKKGQPIEYERWRSISVEEIYGPVNEFGLFVHDEECSIPYGMIYLCLNGNETSHKAPNGMKLSTIGKLQRIKLWCSMIIEKKYPKRTNEKSE